MAAEIFVLPNYAPAPDPLSDMTDAELRAARAAAALSAIEAVLEEPADRGGEAHAAWMRRTGDTIAVLRRCNEVIERRAIRG